MSNEITVLAGTAAFIGFIHTLLGPDHYLPFIAISKARNWSFFKTFVITFLCGIGHVLSSIVLGFLGIAFGVAVFKLEVIESSRGELAGWFLLIFGFLYFVWGIWRVVRLKMHEHSHQHYEGQEHSHSHAHTICHSHVHEKEYKSITPWVLFTIFVFGPCEPLIPLIMYPAAKHNMGAVTMVSFIFGFATISTMLCVVLASLYGLSKFSFGKMEKYSHALAGLTIFLCGGAVKFLGL
jgi:sulfite exporter TauE/SafE